MPKQPSIAIPLDLPDVEVLRTEVTSRRELIIGAEPYVLLSSETGSSPRSVSNRAQHQRVSS